MDQPHIWLQEWKVCDDETRLFDAIDIANAAARKPQK